MSINTNPSELGTISTNVTSILTLAREEHASIVLDSTTGKGTTVYKINDLSGLPRIFSNTGTSAVFVGQISGPDVTASLNTIMIVDTAAFTSSFQTATTVAQHGGTTSTTDPGLFIGSGEHYSRLPNSKRQKNSIDFSAVSSHPAFRTNTPMSVTGMFNSAITISEANTGASVSVAYSTTTTPIFINYATNTSHSGERYQTVPVAFNPVYKTIAIAGTTGTSTTHPLDYPPSFSAAVFNFSYDVSYSTSTGITSILTGSVSATHKGHATIKTNIATTSPIEKVNVAWSDDGKYLAAMCGRTIIVSSMDTSTYIISSVATTTANNDYSSIVWNSNSQLFITGSTSTTGQLLNFNTATNAITDGTFPSGLNSSQGVRGIDKFDNGDLLVRIGSSFTTAGNIKIYNPTSSSTITVNVKSIDTNISTTGNQGMAIAGPSFGSSGELHPFLYQPTGDGSDIKGFINWPSTATLFSFMIYNSSTSSVTLGRQSSSNLPGGNAGTGWAVPYFTKTKYGAICATSSSSTSPVGVFVGGLTDSGTSMQNNMNLIGEWNTFSSSAVFGSGVFVHAKSLYDRTRIKIEPGKTLIIPGVSQYFFTSSNYLLYVSEA